MRERASGDGALLLGCALVMSFAVGAPPMASPGTDPEVRRLKPGVFLFASPDLNEPNFSETVVLLAEYGPKGAMGLVINRPTDWKAGEVLENSSAVGKLLVYWGGPVQTDVVFGLVRFARPPKVGLHVLDDIYLTGKRKDLDTAVRGDEAGVRVRLYAGYSGWRAGQLESEVRRSGWIVAPGDADTVFSKRPEEIWDKVHHLLDRLEAWTFPVRELWQHRVLSGSDRE